MSFVTDSRKFIAKWNATFPLDRKWRQKYGIAFMSEEHLKVNQIDVYLEFLEDEMYSEALEEAQEFMQKEEAFKKGQFILEREDEEEDENEEEAFELLRNIDLTQLNKKEE